MASLCDLGLSSYEDRVYTALLRLRHGTAEEITDESGVPMGRIYDVLNSLESRKIVSRKPDTRPREYIPTDPELVVERLLEKRKQDLKVEEARYESTATELTAQLGQKTPIDGRFWIAYENPRSLFDALTNQVGHTPDEWVMTWTVGSGGMFGLDQTDDYIYLLPEYMFEQEVDFKLLLTAQVIDILPEEAVTKLANAISDYHTFEVRATNKIFNNLDIIDQTSLRVYVADPFDPQSILGVTQIDDPEFVKSVKSSFMDQWNQATQFQPKSNE